MDTYIKVAGTTFHPIPTNESVKILVEGEENGVPYAYAQAILMPEPTNEYDKDAVQVIIQLANGNPFVAGYIPKDNPMKLKIKQPVIATLHIKDYSAVGDYNPSFIISRIEMEA